MGIIDDIAEIQELLKDHTQYSISLGLTGVPAKGNYPKAKVLINNVELWDGIVSGTVLSFTTTVPEDGLNIRMDRPIQSRHPSRRRPFPGRYCRVPSRPPSQ
jgi:hypothetical protein